MPNIKKQFATANLRKILEILIGLWGIHQNLLHISGNYVIVYLTYRSCRDPAKLVVGVRDFCQVIYTIDIFACAQPNIYIQ